MTPINHAFNLGNLCRCCDPRVLGVSLLRRLTKFVCVCVCILTYFFYYSTVITSALRSLEMYLIPVKCSYIYYICYLLFIAMILSVLSGETLNCGHKHHLHTFGQSKALNLFLG